MLFLRKYILLFIAFLLLFQCSRLYFIVYNLSYFENAFFTSFWQTAYNGFWLDISAIAYCLMPFLILDLISIFKSKQSPKWVVNIFLYLEIAIIFLITIADAELFIQWGNKFNSQVLVYITHPIEMALSAGAVNIPKTIGFSLGLLILFCFLIKLILKLLKPIESKFKIKNLIHILILIGLNFIGIRGGTGVATISQSSAIYSNKNIVNAAAINSLWNALYYIFTNTENIYGDKLNYLSENEAETLMQKQLLQTKDSTKLFTISKPNVMVIMLESFTANASQYFTDNNNCTPYLDSIAKQNLSFMQCYASGDRTEKGLVTVLSGYPAQPSSSIIVFPDKMAKLPSISKSLKKQGYTNLFLYGGDCNFASMKSYLKVQNFDKIIDKAHFEKKEQNSKWGAHDGFLFSKALKAINEIKTPFFTTIMTLSSHEPFEVPFAATNLPKNEWYGFKNSIQYADKMLFEFLEKCKTMPWYNNTIIVLVADHGHDIGLQNIDYFGKEKYHIPMVILGGALKSEYKGKQINTIVSQTIIPQLLLNNMQLETTNFNWQTNVSNFTPFAQYHFNNGFGRVWQGGNLLFDNEAKVSYGFKGDTLQIKDELNNGKAFQQQLIKDFLAK